MTRDMNFYKYFEQQIDMKQRDTNSLEYFTEYWSEIYKVLKIT